MMTSGVQSSTSIYSIEPDVDSFFILFPLHQDKITAWIFIFSNMLINEHLTYSNHELTFTGQLY